MISFLALEKEITKSQWESPRRQARSGRFLRSARSSSEMGVRDQGRRTSWLKFLPFRPVNASELRLRDGCSCFIVYCTLLPYVHQGDELNYLSHKSRPWIDNLIPSRLEYGRSWRKKMVSSSCPYHVGGRPTARLPHLGMLVPVFRRELESPRSKVSVRSRNFAIFAFSPHQLTIFHLIFLLCYVLH